MERKEWQGKTYEKQGDEWVEIQSPTQEIPQSMERKEWQGKTYEKQGDEWVEVGTEAAPETPQYSEQFSPGEAALQGFGGGASLGYLPEMQAATEYGLSRILPESMGGGGEPSYEDLLKQWRGREKLAQEEQPFAYGTGAVGGGLALPIPGANVAKGGTALARIGKSVAGGAGMGLVMNPGETEDQFRARLEQAGMGGLTAGAFGTAGAGFQKLGAGASQAKLPLALKLAGARKKDFKEIAKKKSGPALVDFMEKEKLLTPGSTYESVLDKTKGIVQKTGDDISQIYASVSDDLTNAAGDLAEEAVKELNSTRLDAREIALKAIKEARKQLRGEAHGRKALGQLRSELKNLKALSRRQVKTKTEIVPSIEIGPLGEPISVMKQVTTKTKSVPETPLEDLLKYRQSLDRIAGYDKTFYETKAGQKALKIARSQIKKAIDDRIDVVDKVAGEVGGEAASRTAALKKLNDRYGKAKTLLNIAEDRAAGEDAKANIGLLETIAGTGYAASEIAQGKDPLNAITKGLVGATALRVGRKYAPGAGYSAIKAIETKAPRAGDALQRSSPGIIAPWLLMSRED